MNSDKDVILTWEAPETQDAVVSDAYTYKGTKSISEGTVLEEGFDSGALPTDWTVVGADGDGYNWDTTVGTLGFVPHTGADLIASAS